MNLLSAVAIDAASGSLTANPAGLVSTAIGLIGTLVGGGAMMDNRRKDRKIEAMKGQAEST